MFPQGSHSPPSSDDIKGILHAIKGELSVAGIDDELTVLVAHNTCKALKLFAVKSEGVQATSADALTVSFLSSTYSGQRKSEEDKQGQEVVTGGHGKWKPAHRSSLGC